MGTGRSGNGGGRRDNRNWGASATDAGDGVKEIDGYAIFSTKEAIADALGLGNGGQADKWAKKLTDNEEIAVDWYTRYGGPLINALEEKGPSSVEKHIAIKHVSEGSENLRNAINKGGLDKPMIVSRSMSADAFGGDTSVSGIRKMFGKVIHNTGYTSTEIRGRQNTKSSYEPKTQSKSVVCHIKVPSGKGIGQYVRGVSSEASGHEFLFNRGSNFKIIGAWADSKGITHVNLKYDGRVEGKRAKL